MSTPTTTIVPFASLPSCAVNCGPLYDANGACVPPAAAAADETTYDQCFCAYSTLQGLKSDPPSDVCNGACSGDSAGYTSIRDWFTSMCNEVATKTGDASATTSTGSSGSSGGSNSGSSSGSSSGGDHDWLSTHWQWVVMLIVVTVGIIAIWLGACVWRRKYLKKKDRMYELGKHGAARGSATGPWAPGSGVTLPYGDGVNSVLSNGTASVPPRAAVRGAGGQQGSFMNPTMYDEKDVGSKRRNRR